MTDKRNRPTIPPSVERELWARSAGRCEFRGCNELLYKDGLTQRQSNLATIAHIVAFRPDGPRGDPIRSLQLEKDIRNLMLTCKKHGSMIDDRNLVPDYPEALLLEFKRSHEERVRLLTEIKEDAQTHIIMLQARIGGYDAYVSPQNAAKAILPLYPAQEVPFVINLGGAGVTVNSGEDFRVLARGLSTRTNEILRLLGDGSAIKRLSVFALAPVPLLIYFGHLLGDLDHVDLFQRHRDSQEWTWKEDEEADIFYQVFAPDRTTDDKKPVALVLSISASINRDLVPGCLGEEADVYEIRANEPGVDFLKSKARLVMFGYEVRKLLARLRDVYPHERAIHLFGALPAPVAVELGRAIKPFDSPFIVYEFKKEERSYFTALTVNEKISPPTS